MFYSYYPEFTDQRAVEGAPDEMRYKDLSPKEVSRLLFKDGIVYKPNVTSDKKVPFEKYSRFIGMDVDPTDGLKMYNKAQAITDNTGTYKYFTHNCTHVVGEILNAGGLKYDNSNINYIPNPAFENMKYMYNNAHVWQLTK
jgi:hypothetical protein